MISEQATLSQPGHCVNPALGKMLRTIGFDRNYVRAEGAYLYDDTGRRYLDMLAGYAVHNVGRNHPRIQQALIEHIQSDPATLVQLDQPHHAALLAQALLDRTAEHLQRVVFTNSGAEGVEVAIKFARCHTRRPVIIHCNKSFHGLTTGALALNGDHHFRDGFAPLDPHTRCIPFNHTQALSDALAAGDVAAFIVEPIQGKGVNIPAPGYLAEAAALCRAHGALFIADEIQTGLYRTGRFLAIDHEPEAQPDIVILSKALSGGYVPVGAVLMRDDIHRSVYSSMRRAVVHSSTFAGGSLAMAAGLVSLQVLEEEDLGTNAQRMGDQLAAGLREVQSRCEFIHEIRQRGLMIGIEFGRPHSMRLRAAWKMIKSLDRELFPQAITIPLLEDHAILTQVAGHDMDVIKLIPPLTIQDADLQWFFTAFDTVTRQLGRFPGPAWDVLRRLAGHAIASRGKARRLSPVEA